MKTCPYCLEDVKEAATKCPHCQSSLLPEAETGSRYVRYDIDQGIIRLGKFLAVILGILSFVGLVFFSVNINDALEKAGTAKIAALQASVDGQKAQLEAQKAQSESEKSRKQAQSGADRATALSKELADRMEKTRPEMQKVDHTFTKLGQINEILDQICKQPTGPDKSLVAAEVCGNLYTLADNTQTAQIMIGELSRRVSALEVPRPKPLPANTTQVEPDNIQIRELASVSKSAPADGRNYFNILFSVCIRHGSECNERDLDAVEKVIYYLDPKWFAPSVVTTAKHDDGFAYRVTNVPGRSKVTACIYLKGVTSPVARSDFMSFNRARSEGGLLWGREKSNGECASSN